MERPSNIDVDRISSGVALPTKSPLQTGNAIPQSPRSGTRDALTSKITGILSSTYADSEIRTSLETLDARGVKNTPETRRNLRLDVEKEIIQCNAEVINDFGVVSKQLKDVGTALAQLQANCDALRDHVKTARIETAPMLEEAGTLLSRQKEVQKKQILLTAFTSHFELSPDEQAILTSASTPMSDDFFTALSKAKVIHRDCQVLLSSENQRLGREILENVTKTLNAAFQKLSRWLQREFRALEVLENPRLTFAIRRALRAIAERPAMFQTCLDAFAEAREYTLEDSLHKAFTGEVTSEGATLKPIEFSAHEPLRYVGDMLAWAHSTTVSEREALEVLFVSEGDDLAKGIEEGLESEPWSRPEDGEAFDARRALGQLVNRTLNGVTRTLHQRIDQVIRSHEEPVLQYKIANLIVFYRVIFGKLLDQDGGFIQMLYELEQTAISQFRVAMQYHITNVQNEQTSVPDDLAAPEFLSEALEELRALLKSYDTSIANADAESNGLNLLFEEALEPFLDSCMDLSRTVGISSGTVFRMNCLSTCAATLSNYAFASDKIRELNGARDTDAEHLTDVQFQFFLATSGLRLILSKVSMRPQNPQDWVDSEAFQPEILLAASRKLDQFLPSAFTDALENVKRLQSSSLAHEITNKAASRFCDEFQLIENALMQVDEQSMDQGEAREDDRQPLRELFPRTSEEIRILLS
ncbi:MAG: Golgi transport complex subunit 6 [Chrysothrix sp. TS-e1954]|nr:MAG: Golgi transport complex subunit 6 [Chrysothrix sp. TS-e1954]